MKIIVTGGTIDSFYDTDRCTTVCNPQSRIREYLQQTVGMALEGIDFDLFCMKDSRDIDDADRAALVALLEAESETRFVITHGSFTIFETAQYVQQRLRRSDATITFIGALFPLFGFSPTDAPFALGCALTNSRLNAPGVHVAIKGGLFTPQQVQELHS